MDTYTVGTNPDWQESRLFEGFSEAAAYTIRVKVEDGNAVAISLSEGPSPHYAGAVMSAREWLDFREPLPRLIWNGVSYDKVTYPAGWFERRCEDAQCSWFLPFAKRMADGETVTMEEIQQAYRENNNGADMAKYR